MILGANHPTAIRDNVPFFLNASAQQVVSLLRELTCQTSVRDLSNDDAGIFLTINLVRLGQFNRAMVKLLSCSPILKRNVNKSGLLRNMDPELMTETMQQERRAFVRRSFSATVSVVRDCQALIWSRSYSCVSKMLISCEQHYSRVEFLDHFQQLRDYLERKLYDRERKESLQKDSEDE